VPFAIPDRLKPVIFAAGIFDNPNPSPLKMPAVESMLPDAVRLDKVPTEVMLGCAAVVNEPATSVNVPVVPATFPPVMLPVALTTPAVVKLPPATLPVVVKLVPVASPMFGVVN
jgi:hypothetical protein